MARKDVILRYAQIESEYMEMMDLIKELDQDLKENKIPQDYYNEKVELISEEIEKIKTQYFFWAEAIFELNKPQRKSKKLSKFDEEWYNSFKTYTREAIIDDSKDALKHLKQLIKDGKING